MSLPLSVLQQFQIPLLIAVRPSLPPLSEQQKGVPARLSTTLVHTLVQGTLHSPKEVQEPPAESLCSDQCCPGPAREMVVASSWRKTKSWLPLSSEAVTSSITSARFRRRLSETQTFNCLLEFLSSYTAVCPFTMFTQGWLSKIDTESKWHMLYLWEEDTRNISHFLWNQK